jgi:hypothetical protein
MKRPLLLLIILSIVTPAFTQVASTECIVEAKAVYGHIDHQNMLDRDQATLLRYEHRYIMKTDPKAEKRGGEETRIYARKFMHHMASDFEECTDATEAFNHRKFQFMVYRTASTLSKAGLVPGVDRGIFDHCLVRRCEFIPAPGQDSSSHKQAFLTVDAEGQKKYRVKDLEMVWDPVSGDMVSLIVNFTERSRTQWASYKFLEINDAYTRETPISSAASIFLSGEGLADRFKGSELKDYR